MKVANFLDFLGLPMKDVHEQKQITNSTISETYGYKVLCQNSFLVNNF